MRDYQRKTFCSAFREKRIAAANAARNILIIYGRLFVQ